MKKRGGNRRGAARNAVDCALWDLEAKRAGRPVWMLAGLAQPRPLQSAFTISLGEQRTFRLTRKETKGRRDFPATDGAVFVTPWETNLAWKHQVTKSARGKGRRISITLRAFFE